MFSYKEITDDLFDNVPTPPPIVRQKGSSNLNKVNLNYRR